ncbi:MAG: heme o synthase [Myxococcota bacterium]
MNGQGGPAPAPVAVRIDAIDAEAPPTSSLPETLRLLVDITRPRVIALVVFTGLPALWLGKDTWPTPAVSFWVLLGTALAGGASSAFNAVIERDTDARMARTRNRPLPAASLMPGAVAVYGALLTVASTAILTWIGGVLAAALALVTIAFYVGVYTVWLKPRTPQNIVIGGAAGATAPLIASAAVDGHVSVGAWVLFLVVCLWTPPHFWAIAIFRRHEYESAGFPMMPSVVGDQATRWRSLGYTVAMIGVSLVPVWLGHLGWLYGAAAVGLGGWFCGWVIRSMVAQRPVVDWRVFKVSVAYLGLLFLVMLADLLVRG